MEDWKLESQKDDESDQDSSSSNEASIQKQKQKPQKPKHREKNEIELDREHYWKGKDFDKTTLKRQILEEWNKEIYLLMQNKSQTQTLNEKECCAEHVIRVWEEIGEFIQLTLSKGKGVKIAGLGTFTFKISNKSKSKYFYEILKTPLLILSDFLIQNFGLEQPISEQENTQIPIIPLNVMIIEIKSQLSRATVEGCITEVLQAFARGIITDKDIEFPFSRIGKLKIKNRQVEMKFYQEFYKKLSFNLDIKEIEELEDNVIVGRMTPIKHHIPSQDYRSVFHLREVRSVHNLKSQNQNHLSLKLSLKMPPNSQIVRVRKVYDTDDEENDDEIKACLLKGEIPMEERILFKAKPLHETRRTGLHLVDVLLSRQDYFQRFLRDHHYHLCSSVLGPQVVLDHLSRRPKYQKVVEENETESNQSLPQTAQTSASVASSQQSEDHMNEKETERFLRLLEIANRE